MRKFKDFDWEKVARAMGGAVRRQTSQEVEIAVGTGARRFRDLRGEIIIEKIEVVDPAVVYNDRLVSDRTLATRLTAAIAGEAVDYGRDMDPAEEEGDGEEE